MYTATAQESATAKDASAEREEYWHATTGFTPKIVNA
jgi:hypothetical protein